MQPAGLLWNCPDDVGDDVMMTSHCIYAAMGQQEQGAYTNHQVY